MAWTKVGQTTDVVQGNDGTTTPINVTLPGSLAQDDIVLVGQTADNAVSNPVTSGYAQIVTGGGAQDPGRDLAYKLMGATPDSVVAIDEDVQNDRDIAVLVQVWRGVDITTPIDAAPTTAGGGGAPPNPPPFTIATSGALRIIFGFLDNDDSASSSSAPVNFTDFLAGDTENASTSQGSTSMIASQEEATVGAEDPAAFTSSDDTWFAVHFALRPAAGAAAAPKGPLGLPLHGPFGGPI